MSKKQLLPPSGGSRKREVSVNLRFSVDDHRRLKHVADFSGTTVASLLHYVTIHTTLPLMEQEVRQAHAAQQRSPEEYQITDLPDDDTALDPSEEEST
ncbi:MAG: hypothetical protein ABI947_23035 [Chloroflexota bacterium]